MSRNGSGTYSLPAGNPVVTGTAISSSTHNITMTDVANALTTSIASDGQTVPTANLPMGGFKFTNLASGTIAGDSVNYTQMTNGTLAPTFGVTIVANSTAATLQAVPRSQADTLYAALAGLSTQVFSVATATAGNHAVTKTQFDAGIAAIPVSNGEFRSILPYTANTTYSKPAGLVRVKVTVIGGGAGGRTGIGTSSGGAGGGAGATSIRVLPASSLAASETVTIGAGGAAINPGGASSFGSFMTANGGGIGDASGGGGGGGAASGGDINIEGGGAGGGHNGGASVVGIGGAGGNSSMGGGARGSVAAGGNAGGYGGGGGGGGGGNTNFGGTGKGGIVIIEEFF